MGTNIYLKTEAFGDRELHVGKFSAGWVFALQVLPDKGLNSLDDWEKRIGILGFQLMDEYGDHLTLQELLDLICERSWPLGWDEEAWFGYKSEADFHRSNHSERGPNNLLRSKIDGGHCVGHGPMWDLIAGDFS